MLSLRKWLGLSMLTLSIAYGFSRTNWFFSRHTQQNVLARAVQERIAPPTGFKRPMVAKGSFAEFLRTFPLKPNDAKVYYYDTREKTTQNDHVAVLDIDIGNEDLQQCADAVIRLRAEYLFAQKHFNEIQFRFTSGHLATWKDYAAGKRAVVKELSVVFKSSAKPDHSRQNFRRYLDMIFRYAGTFSLDKELKSVNNQHIGIGDVLIEGGFPGHAMLIVDEAINDNGEKVFLLAQSFMPAQSIHIVTNPFNRQLSPWYRLNSGTPIPTVEYFFKHGAIKSF